MNKPKLNNTEGTVFCNCNYWPMGILPYQFDAGLEQYKRDAALNAMSRLESVANINFVERNGESNYIFIKESGKPFNYSDEVGFSNGKHEIGIVSWDVPMIICHELMHVLGFWHEQSRPDRDNYVEVNFGNICPGSTSQFNIENTGVTPNIPYDFISIMHYGSYYFSKCKNPNENCDSDCPGGYLGPTLKIKPAYQNGQNFIGNRSYLSPIDSMMLRFTYPYSSDRFVNNQYVGPVTSNAGLTIYEPLPYFSTDTNILNKIPSGSDVWIMPGNMNNAEGIYTKHMILRAPFGNVILR